MIQKMGDASFGVTGRYEVSYKAQPRAGVNSNLLQSKYPEIAEEVATKSEFRVMRIKQIR
jgi:predicted phage-related endonuclease